MDYSKMSDFEINSAVSMAMARKSVKPESKYVVINDYCNNPTDSWPIIAQNKISLNHFAGEGVWCAHAEGLMTEGCWCWDVDPEYYYDNTNPLRAAMIVFLMMQENK